MGVPAVNYTLAGTIPPLVSQRPSPAASILHAPRVLCAVKSFGSWVSRGLGAAEPAASCVLFPGTRKDFAHEVLRWEKMSAL